MRKVTKLPPADAYGNYWLDSAHRPKGSVILKAGLPEHTGNKKSKGWFASLGDRGVLFDPLTNEIAYFDSPEKALEEMMR